MSMFWSYYTTSRDRWQSIFGNHSDQAIKQVLASYMWERLDGDVPDFEADQDAWFRAVIEQTPKPVVQLVTDLCSNGFSYAQRSTEDAAVMDKIMTGFFCPEGLEELLSIERVGGDGIKSFILEELLKRGQAKKSGGFLGFGGKLLPGTPVELSPFLVSGRRFASDQQPGRESTYVVFMEHELPKLREEIERLLRQDRPWSDQQFETEVMENTLAAVIKAESTNRILFGRHG